MVHSFQSREKEKKEEREREKERGTHSERGSEEAQTTLLGLSTNKAKTERKMKKKDSNLYFTLENEVPCLSLSLSLSLLAFSTSLFLSFCILFFCVCVILSAGAIHYPQIYMYKFSRQRHVLAQHGPWRHSPTRPPAYVCLSRLLSFRRRRRLSFSPCPSCLSWQRG